MGREAPSLVSPSEFASFRSICFPRLADKTWKWNLYVRRLRTSIWMAIYFLTDMDWAVHLAKLTSFLDKRPSQHALFLSFTQDFSGLLGSKKIRSVSVIKGGIQEVFVGSGKIFSLLDSLFSQLDITGSLHQMQDVPDSLTMANKEQLHIRLNPGREEFPLVVQNKIFSNIL